MRPGGAVVVIDHKTTRVDDPATLEISGDHVAQLAAYREALEATGLEVDSLWIHFALDGVAARVG